MLGSNRSSSIHFGPDRYGETYDQTRHHPIAMTIGAAVLGLGLAVGVGFGAAAFMRETPFTPPPQADPAAIAEAFAPPPPLPDPPAGPQELQDALERLARSFGEPVGIAITDVTDGWTVAVNGDRAFPQQSVSKLWVAISVLDSVDRGRFTLDEQVRMRPEDRSVFTQPLARQVTDADGFEISVDRLLQHAIVRSDNSANDRLITLVGEDTVNYVLTARRLEGIRLGADERNLQSLIAGMEWRPEYGLDRRFEEARARLPRAHREAAMQAYVNDPLDGATPVGITRALASLERGELLSPQSTNYLLDIMADVRTGPNRLKGGVPAGWTVRHKTGTGQDLGGKTTGYNDVGLITAPDGRSYSVAVMMQRTGKPNVRRMEFMQKVSRTLVDHWNASSGATKS